MQQIAHPFSCHYTEEVTAEENQAADETHQSQRSILQERVHEGSGEDEEMQ